MEKKMKTETLNPTTAKVNADNKRIDRLKEQLRSTPYEVDFERVRMMAKVYEDTAGEPADHASGQVPGYCAGAEKALHRR